MSLLHKELKKKKLKSDKYIYKVVHVFPCLCVILPVCLNLRYDGYGGHEAVGFCRSALPLASGSRTFLGGSIVAIVKHTGVFMVPLS